MAPLLSRPHLHGETIVRSLVWVLHGPTNYQKQQDFCINTTEVSALRRFHEGRSHHFLL